MRVLCIAVLLTALVLAAAAKQRVRKFDGDFEFAEEDDSSKGGEKKRWILDPDSPLCRPLRCKQYKELCLLEDLTTAVCVGKKELRRNGDVVIPRSRLPSSTASPSGSSEDEFYDSEDDEEEDDTSESITNCSPCPVVRPTFLCGADNRTYSSLCRLDYHNCIHGTAVGVACKGFCPCKEKELVQRKKERQQERYSQFVSKYRATVEKQQLQTPQPLQQQTAQDVTAPTKKANKKAVKLDSKYTFTPEDFKYDNKHYKYIKYTKYNKGGEEKDKQRVFNEVLEGKPQSGDRPVSAAPPQASAECGASQLQSMGDRMLDWFSVVMADAASRGRPRQRSNSKANFPGSCQAEVRWMFGHLDRDADSRLSLHELYGLEHDQSEKCMKPFLDSCDTDLDVFVGPDEWCRCFEKTERPCEAVKRGMSPKALREVYVPDCDLDGFFRAVQCGPTGNVCWCVDKHGVAVPGTRVFGKPSCNELLNKTNKDQRQGQESNQLHDSSDDDEDDDDDDDVEGSADQPLDF